MATTERWVEYVAEPVNADGDIIDPDFADSLEQTRARVPHMMAQFPDAVYVDVAKVFNVGNEDDGIADRRYAYIDRTYRDGRVVRLKSISGPSREPVEVR
jgi:hypothetical protein